MSGIQTDGFGTIFKTGEGAGGGSAGPGGSGTYVFRAGASRSGNVYPTFEEAYADLQAAGGFGTIVVDDSIAQCNITTPGNYDLSGAVLTCPRYKVQTGGTYTILFVQDGVTFNGGISITGSLAVLTEYVSGSAVAVTVQGGNLSPVYVNLDYGAAFVLDGNGSTLCPNGRYITVNADHGAALYAYNTVAFGSAGGQVQCNLYEGGGVDNTATGVGTFSFDIWSASAGAPTAPPSGFTGNFTVNYHTNSAFTIPYGFNGPPPNQNWVQEGSTYFDYGTQKPYWWTGNAWTHAVPPRTVMQMHASVQTTNLAAGDLVAFDSLDYTRGSNANPVSPGVLNLGPGTWRVTASVPQVTGTGPIHFQLKNITSGTHFGPGLRFGDAGGDVASHSQIVAYIDATVNTQIGLDIMFNSGVTAIGAVAASPMYAWILCEEVF